MINKRGNITQHVIFLIIEVVIGALILIGATHLVLINIMDTEIEIVAKDLSLTISTIISSPSNMYFTYAPNTEDKHIIIQDNKITVTKDDEKATYQIYALDGVTIEDGNLNKVLSIPLLFEDKTLKFSSKTQADFCEKIPDYMTKNTKVYLTTYNKYSGFKESINQIKELIEVRQKKDSDETFEISNIETKETINIILSVNENNDKSNIELEYYESYTNKNYRKIACILANNLEEKQFEELGEVKQTKQDTTPQIIINIGNQETFKKYVETPTNIDIISKTIYEKLKEVIK
ncbi:hypothetical protein K9L67_03695 [Candidatus Woesearchaeota archaeon]|nr:hypothetical protein [Candidatus Woesearchaeota archaeon]MCF7901305.1 hypothetical protein [Candidatus Woesearchaeota archaeon]MCF8013789.1 hypothetical protein [Candidatus Woesearchaeota archaeon]